MTADCRAAGGGRDPSGSGARRVGLSRQPLDANQSAPRPGGSCRATGTRDALAGIDEPTRGRPRQGHRERRSTPEEWRGTRTGRVAIPPRDGGARARLARRGHGGPGRARAGDRHHRPGCAARRLRRARRGPPVDQCAGQARRPALASTWLGGEDRAPPGAAPGGGRRGRGRARSGAEHRRRHPGADRSAGCLAAEVRHPGRVAARASPRSGEGRADPGQAPPSRQPGRSRGADPPEGRKADAARGLRRRRPRDARLDPARRRLEGSPGVPAPRRCGVAGRAGPVLHQGSVRGRPGAVWLPDRRPDGARSARPARDPGRHPGGRAAQRRRERVGRRPGRRGARTGAARRTPSRKCARR
jgi:hypothetical protein